MDTNTFLKLILPDSGVKYLARIKPRPGNKNGDATIHAVVADADDAAEKLLEMDRKFPDQNIYSAMASYKEPQYRTVKLKDGRDFEYIVGRTQDNALEVKSIWLDLDVGKVGCYETQREAAAAVMAYCKETDLPQPLIVSSGYGLHCYWPFTEAVSVDEWESIVKYQRVAWRHLGVKADPACDQDCARILRAPGCYNKKAGRDPKLVRVLSKSFSPMPPGEIKRRLKGYVERNNLDSKVKADVPDWIKNGQMKGNLDDIQFPKAYAAIAVSHCNQFKEFSKTGGVSYDHWRLTLGALKFCEDGYNYSHIWGSEHAEYSEEETDAKIASLTASGPTYCVTYKSDPTFGHLCQGCNHKCSTPIQLGQNAEVEKPNIIALVQQETTEEPADATDDATTQESTEDVVETAKHDATDDGVPLGWPRMYGHNKSGSTTYVTRKVRDANGVWQEINIATPLFYPVEQIRAEDGTFALRIHCLVRGKIREFTLPQKYTADPKSLRMQLHANGIQVLDAEGTASYLSNFATEIQQTREETETYRQMGWQHNQTAWLIGDTLITANEERKVVLSPKFPKKQLKLSERKGEIQPWVDAVETLFNKENGEPYQFAICAAFAAPMHALLDYSEWRGIPYAITTNESGFGKTTVNMIANSIWGNPELMKFSNCTPKVILGFASAFNNVPFLLDEVTSYLNDPVSMGDTLYALSNGRGRDGMTGGGEIRDSLPEWTGVHAMTGNRNVIMQVAENRLNPEAIQMRVFEIDLDTYPRLTAMDKNHKDYELYNDAHSMIAKTVVNDHYGHIGAKYIQHIIRRQKEVRAKLRKVSENMTKHMKGGDATKERFYYHLVACVLVAGHYAKELGFINFDLTKLRHWCVQHVERIREAVADTRFTPQDHYAAMMNELVGRLIVTRNFDSLDARTGKVETHKGPPIRGSVAGRFVVGDDKERPKLFITVQAVQHWCFENGVSFNALRRDFLRERIIRLGMRDVKRETGAVKVAIGRGVEGYQQLSNPWCMEFDVESASNILPADVAQLDEKRVQPEPEPVLDDDQLVIDL